MTTKRPSSVTTNPARGWAPPFSVVRDAADGWWVCRADPALPGVSRAAAGPFADRGAAMRECEKRNGEYLGQREG
jgi:hypothetical protein